MDQWLRNTNVVKVVALVIGILLWAVVRMDGGSIPGSTGTGIAEETIGNVAVTPKYNEDQLFIENISPAQVTVTISGRSSTLKRVLNSANYSVELDLTNRGRGEHMVPLTPVGFPSSVSVKITPAYVNVVVDEKKNKSMPVTVNVTGTPGVGLKAGQPVVKPKQVTVSVPSGIYEAVETVRADVDVDKAASPVTSQAKLVAYDKAGKAIEEAIINPAVVEVEVPITSPFKLVPLQVKLVGEPPQGYAVSGIHQSVDKVTVFGTQEMLDGLEFYEGPQVDLSDLREDKEFTLPIPPQGDVKQLDPSEVTVSVSIVRSQTKALDNIPLSLIGQNDGFQTKVLLPESGKLNLTVEGAPDLIEKLMPQDVQAILDVSNLPPGRHEVPVTWNLPTFVKKGPQQNFRATVEISAKEGEPAAPSAAANPFLRSSGTHGFDPPVVVG
ncbi:MULTISPECIES: CdaR family protein [unclassified Paenibacillus]|uniref:CdaR family protein n=1 Tax=unclassified Paenibacillus TaxID=185978 RepID=UPI001AE30F9C|nr:MULTISPECIES: CdaR family protein [unclassified Paenibacillus]MBP1153635.1 YbbR domain-containing protein [Paenibacillus sp. PvP091]MBP1170980.1 YbbR domain-containing protein [Paenibacillus sp. PvR098]MBP2442008.1 YbbR domain-containing protein [Paenibacillus sp. PvP052]